MTPYKITITKPTAKCLTWGEQRQMFAMVVDGYRALSLVIQELRGKYAVMALETTMPDGPMTAEYVFSNHSHQVITEDAPTIAKAKRAANAFARTWKKTKADAPRCACGPIASKRTRRAS